jgi:hypothetical protein
VAELQQVGRRGQVVALQLDGSGFVRAVGPAETNNCAPLPGASTVVDTVGPSKDMTITRLAVLKAAAEFAAGRADVKSGDVLAIAERWEAWANRKEGESRG